MGKAIAGAAELAGAGALFLAMDFATGGLGAIANTPAFFALMTSLAAGGISMEASAIAESLTSQRGQNITTRQAAGLRQIVYGQQRIGGTTVYQSTTGAGGSLGNYIYNYIIAVATHEIDSYINLYLDGRQVYWSQTATGYKGNIGNGTLSTPPTTTVTISGGVITAISASGGSGLGNVMPKDGYRVHISDTGGGSGAEAWATNTGSTSSPVWSVTVTNGGSGYSAATVADVQGSYTFGGIAAADQQDPSQPGYGLGYGIGPGGAHYDFAGKVYCEVRFGDQPASDYMQSLSHNDSVWPSTANGGGVAYIYLNIGYDAIQFPTAPEIRLTINGKNNIFDPRTGTTGFSTNWALQVADVISDPVWGLNDNTVNQAQLIAAANVCDEAVETSQGNEYRYTQHIHYDTSTAVGDALSMMMPTAAGRLSRVGGEWYIYPAYWQGPSFTFDESNLVDSSYTWNANRSLRDLINCVNGTYIAPNFPYSAVAPFSNLYDTNGWYYGTIDNLWPFAWQATNFPQYAEDSLHGYAGNEFLVEDGGIVLPQELTLRGVISVVQAQRIAKITLLRNRQQGSGSFQMNLAAWQMQPLDVMQFSMPVMGWSDKYLEVNKIQFLCEPQKDQSGDDGPLALSCMVGVNETDSSVYEWFITEELTPYDVPADPQQIPYAPAPPTSLTVTSSAATAILGADGNLIPRALLQWTAPQDTTVVGIDMQYQLAGASVWQDAGTVNVDLFEAFVGNLIAGQTYNFQIRSVRASGTFSEWVQALGEVISISLSTSVTSGLLVAPPGTLIGQAETGGTADIIVQPFAASVGQVTVNCLTAGNYILTGLNQNQLYFVYYIDPTFSGGAITPIATQNESDFLNKLGYFLIGDLITPTGSSTVYRPSTYQLDDTVTTTNPTFAFDGNPATCAVLNAYDTSGSYGYDCQCQYYGFTNTTLAASATMNVSASVTGVSGSGCTAVIEVTLNSGLTFTTLLSTSSDSAITNYTMTVPSGTPVGGILVRCTASSSNSLTGAITLNVYEIYVQ